MMLRFTTYDRETGRIGDRWEAPDMDVAMANIDPATEGTIEGHVDGLRFYRRPDGTLAEYPPQPSLHHVFDFAAEAWIDPRTPEDIAAEEAAALQAAREAASLSRIDFILASVQAGIITTEDAKAAARGEVPPSLASLIDGLSPEQRLAAEVTWAAARTVERLNPLIVTWAGMLGLTDADLDALFGVAPPA